MPHITRGMEVTQCEELTVYLNEFKYTVFKFSLGLNYSPRSQMIQINGIYLLLL